MTARGTWPACVRDLPVCPVTRLPVPFSSGTDPETGAGRFGANDPLAKMLCAARSLCGVCGGPLPSPVVFLARWGPPVDLESLVFNDPPMCPPCAEAAIRLCPRIRAGRPGTPGWLCLSAGSSEAIPGPHLVAFRPVRPSGLRRYDYGPSGLVLAAEVAP